MLEIDWCCEKKGKVEWVQRAQGTSLVVQWGRLFAPIVGDLDSIPGQRTRSHIPQPRVQMAQLKIPKAATTIWSRQIKKFF